MTKKAKSSRFALDWRQILREAPQRSASDEGPGWDSMSEVSPAEWWDELLESQEPRQAEQMRDALEELLKAGHSRADLLVALWNVEDAVRRGSIHRTTLIRHAKQLESAVELLVDLFYSVVLGRTDEQNETLRRAFAILDVEEIEAREVISALKRNPDAERKRTVYELVDLVQQRDGQPRYSALLPLLRGVGESMTENALRAMVSRHAKKHGGRRKKSVARRPKVMSLKRPKGRPRKVQTAGFHANSKRRPRDESPW